LAAFVFGNQDRYRVGRIGSFCSPDWLGRADLELVCGALGGPQSVMFTQLILRRRRKIVNIRRNSEETPVTKTGQR
jgi:hypothetical protein